MINQLNEKFWSFKDTQNYSYIKELYMLGKPEVLRTFIFKKSFLLEISIDGETHYVIPTKFVSKDFPSGFYESVGEIKERKLCFLEQDIKKIF